MNREAIIELGKLYIDGRLPKEYSEGSEVTPDEALRKGFNQLLGLSDDNRVVNKKVLRAHEAEVFAILEEIVEVKVNEGLSISLEPLVEYRNLALGDTNEFIIPDNKYFRVATISDGNGNLRRQRLRDGESYTVAPEIKGVAIYEEFVRWMAGRVDFLGMVDKVSESMLRHVKEEIYTAVITNFREGGAGEPYRKTISGGVPTEKDILTMAKHLEAKTDAKVVIYGTALALSSLDIKYPDEGSKAVRNNQGYYGKVAGIDTIEIPAMHKVGTDEFLFEDDAILFLPQTDDKMVKVVNEGEAFILKRNELDRVDLQSEYLLTQKIGIGVTPSSQFGFMKFKNQ